MKGTNQPTFAESFAALDAHEAYLATHHESAVERVKAVFSDAGFGFTMEFSPSANINDHTDEHLPPVHIIGIGNPRVGKVLAKETGGNSAAFAPCTVAIQQVAEDRQRVYHVNLPRVLEAVGAAPDDYENSESWQQAVEVSTEAVSEAFERLHNSDVAVSHPDD